VIPYDLHVKRISLDIFLLLLGIGVGYVFYGFQVVERGTVFVVSLLFFSLVNRHLRTLSLVQVTD